MNYVGRSNSGADATVAEGPSGPVRILLSNPNSTSVSGTLYLRDTDDAYQLTKFTVDGNVPLLIDLGMSLAAHQLLYLTLTAAPTAQLIIWSTG